jgi:hypothetical protein
MELSPLREASSHSGTQEIYIFLEHTVSSPYWQEPATAPYYETAEYNIHHTILFKIDLRLGIPSCLFPSGFPTKLHMYFKILSERHKSFYTSAHRHNSST